MKNGPYILVKAPENYPGKKYRGKYCYEHVLVWWQNTGEIPGDDEQIHHKDEDKHNNVFENLEKIKNGAHQKLHHKDDMSACVEFKCPGCGILFVKEKRQSHLTANRSEYTTCSRECSGKVSHIQRRDPELYKRLLLENVIRELDVKINHSQVSQPVESLTVNQDVAGSIPALGATSEWINCS